MVLTVHDGSSRSISTVHQDIIQTHIFTCLDGPTLASLACASSNFRTLSSDNTLWCEICNATWPSTSSLRHVISSFPSGHRSFYSDSFPALHHVTDSVSHPPPASELISAVDLRFQGSPILSRMMKTETKSDWFMSSPFRVDVLDPKETVQTGFCLDTDACLEHNLSLSRILTGPKKTVQTGVCLDACLEQNLSLSWVLVDPKRARAANFSSSRPVSVTRHWLTGNLLVRFATILNDVQCAAVVTCKGNEAGEVAVKEVSFVVEDMEGRSLSGEESLVILQGAIENGERKRRRDGDEERERYDAFLERKREMRERKERKEKRMDMVCVFTVVTLLVTWGAFMLKVTS